MPTTGHGWKLSNHSTLDSRFAPGVLLYSSPPWFHMTGSLTEPGIPHFSWAAGQQTPGICLFLPLVWGIQTRTVTPGMLPRCWGSELAQQALLPTEPSPRPLIRYSRSFLTQLKWSSLSCLLSALSPVCVWFRGEVWSPAPLPWRLSSTGGKEQ